MESCSRGIDADYRLSVSAYTSRLMYTQHSVRGVRLKQKNRNFCLSSRPEIGIRSRPKSRSHLAFLCSLLEGRIPPPRIASSAISGLYVVDEHGDACSVRSCGNGQTWTFFLETELSRFLHGCSFWRQNFPAFYSWRAAATAAASAADVGYLRDSSNPY